ncbi:MAG: peptide chain release factor N(5)-glutamine methyltransferase [Dethiobacter sp.]|jgi:release factor glutamine methyltransferase|nr:peptide chain release factor N(5)-glutamine methyltransferase [Dethiobacter sp.]
MSITIKEALNRASFKLRNAGIELPRREAEALMCGCLEISLACLYAHGEGILTADDNVRFTSWVSRRAAGEPYAYIIGLREFMGLDFLVTPAVLVPRPETEILVEAVHCELKNHPSPRILEIGTGSGAIAVSLAVLLRAAHVTATDVSLAALEVAAKNASRHGVQDRVHCLHSDLYDRGTGELSTFINCEGAAYHAVVSNPPYIATTEIALLAPTVREFEPLGALDGGDDGLSFYRRLTGELDVLPHRPHLLVFEVGAGQAEAVAGLCRQAGYKTTRQFPDLSGIPRVILAQD